MNTERVFGRIEEIDVIKDNLFKHSREMSIEQRNAETERFIAKVRQFKTDYPQYDKTVERWRKWWKNSRTYVYGLNGTEVAILDSHLENFQFDTPERAIQKLQNWYDRVMNQGYMLTEKQRFIINKKLNQYGYELPR